MLGHHHDRAHTALHTLLHINHMMHVLKIVPFNLCLESLSLTLTLLFLNIALYCPKSFHLTLNLSPFSLLVTFYFFELSSRLSYLC